MLHRSCNNWLVEGNQSFRNADSGIAIFACSFNGIYDNVCVSNGNAGIRFSVGAASNLVDGNEVGYSGKNAFYLYQGNDPPEADDDDPVNAGRPRQNTIANNIIYNYGTEGIKVDNGDGNLFFANRLTNTGTNTTALRFAESVNNSVISNTLPANAGVRLIGSPTNHTTTMILGQPSVRLLIDAYSTGRFEDDHGFVFQANRGTLPTVVNSGGSVAMATLAGLGGNATVILRNLRAQPSSGSVTVTATGWNLNGNSAKSWTARTSAAANVQFTVGDLTPGTAYFVNDGTGGRGKGKGKGGGGTTGGVGVFTANGSGTITFTHQPGTAGKTYTVVRN
jgi:hypothetical protein